MDYDYQYGNNYYKYYGNKGIRSTIYNILAPEQSQKTQPGSYFRTIPVPVFSRLKTHD